jgi:hypothetical protein
MMAAAPDGRGSQRCMAPAPMLANTCRFRVAAALPWRLAGGQAASSARCDVGRQADHLRQHTPDFNRFHSSLGLPPKSRLVKFRHCGSSERWHYSPMAVDHRNRRRAEPVRRPDRRVLIEAPVRRGRTAGAGGVDPRDPRRPSACQPGTTSCGRPTHQPSGPCLFTGLYTDE